MKKITSIILVAFLILGAFVTPAFAAVGDNSFTERESNNSTSLADRIYNDYTVSGTISSRSDIDFFCFTLSSSSKVDILLMTGYSVLMVGIADSYGEIIDAAYMYYDDGYYWHSYSDTLPAGTYYIVILEDQDYSYSGVSYMFYYEYETTAHTHSYTSRLVSPTCTQQGYTVYTCSSCGYSYNSSYTSARGHSYGSWTVVTPATCSSTGVKKKVCSTCGYSVTETIAKTTHTPGEWIVDSEGTCSEEGYQHKECVTCGEIVETQYVTSGAHTARAWQILEEATVYKVGVKVKICENCGEIFDSGTIPQLKCSKPTIKSIENSEYGVLTRWGKVKGADKYYIYRKVSGGSYSRIGSTTSTYFTDKTAKSGKKYYYIVKAVNEAGTSSSSDSKSKYHLSDPTLNTPSSTSKGVGLRWSKVTGASGYMVYRRTETGSYKLISTEKGVSNLTFRDTTARKGRKYYYKVKAYKSVTYSAYSNTKSVTDKY